MDEHVTSFNEALRRLQPDGLTLVENPKSRAASWALMDTYGRPAPSSCDLYACSYIPGRVFISGSVNETSLSLILDALRVSRGVVQGNAPKPPNRLQAEYVKCVNELDSIVERMKKVGSTIPRQTYTLDLSQREAWLSGLKGESARALSLLLDTLEDALDGGNTLTLIAPDGPEVEEEITPSQDPDERSFIGSGEVEVENV